MKGKDCAIKGTATGTDMSNNTFTVVPVFNWQYGGWGYWFFGVWVPLY